MVGLAESPQEYVEQRLHARAPGRARSSAIAREHGMPIDTRARPRMAATMPACRAVVAARLHAPERRAPAAAPPARAPLLPASCSTSPRRSRPPRPTRASTPSSSRRWAAGRRRRARRCAADMARAREPMRRRPRARREARELVRRAALHVPVATRSCGVADGVTIAVPGFQPFAVYDVVTGQPRARASTGATRPRRRGGARVDGHAAGDARRSRSSATSACAEARERLGRVAVEQHVGADGFWTLDGGR